LRLARVERNLKVEGVDHVKHVALHNHAPDIVAIDLFVVPTFGFGLLYAFVIVSGSTLQQIPRPNGLHVK
jgi:hypothetical protein